MTVLAAVCTKMPEAKLSIIFLPMFTFSAANVRSLLSCHHYWRVWIKVKLKPSSWRIHHERLCSPPGSEGHHRHGYGRSGVGMEVFRPRCSFRRSLVRSVSHWLDQSQQPLRESAGCSSSGGHRRRQADLNASCSCSQCFSWSLNLFLCFFLTWFLLRGERRVSDIISHHALCSPLLQLVHHVRSRADLEEPRTFC